MLESQWQTLTAQGEISPDGAGLVVMNDVTILTFTGSDVRNFLQGYFTCDTLGIARDQFQPAAMCNLQGRVVAFGWATGSGEDELLWLVPDSLVADLQSFLKPYLAFSKTRLEPMAEDHLVLASVSPSATGNISSRLNFDIVRTAQALDQLHSNQGTGQRSQIDLLLIEEHVPWLTSVNAGKFLPQMLGLVDLDAVSFDKGCYLGQEVVARAQHRGQVKRHLQSLRHDRPEALEAGTEIIDANDRVVGTVIFSAANDTDGKSLCVMQTSAQSPFSDRRTGLNMHP